MHVGLVGYGVVGRASAKSLSRSPSLRVASLISSFLDTPRAEILQESLVDRADVVFVSVPTPYDRATEASDIPR